MTSKTGKKTRIRVWGKAEWITERGEKFKNNITIAGGMRALRTSSQVSQAEVAKQMGVTTNVVWRMEAGYRLWYPSDAKNFAQAVSNAKRMRGV